MDSRIHAVVAGHGGLATAPMLAAAGIEAREVARLVRRQSLVAVRRGVYTTGELWESWDDFLLRPLARVRAAEHSLVVEHVSSHDSAALLHRLPLLDARSAAVHISRLDLRGHRTQHGIEHHGASYDADQIVSVDGLPTLDIARTVCDLAREHGYREGLVAADGAMQLGVPRAALRDAARRMAGWPYSLTVRAVVKDADPGAESVGETLARELVRECGWGSVVETQFPVAVSTGVAWADLRVGRHLVEFNGRVKYRSTAEGGLRDGDLEELMWQERRREADERSAGFGVTPLVYADFFGDRRAHAKARLMREEALTRSRHGTALTAEMTAFADRWRGRRYKSAG
ncbi:hypothetical protein GCM10009623_14050 [Nocardioides aestuarii]|uniref:Type IV toxin-antitoxin system AbiEi family antitoxin domain-containing protein n=1 Tax=Nocardioides aestuarii TaxID=252231 RepID=A0ABW4TIS6_9ACTN